MLFDTSCSPRQVLSIASFAAAAALAGGCATTGSTTGRAPGAFVQDIDDTALSFEMVGVPGGIVSIETENGTETVRVEPFWISPVELTWDVYDVFALRLDRRRSVAGSEADALTRPSNPYLPPDRGYGHGGYPAISISHHGATSFCQWLSLKTGRHYRLPTEAEWRHACALGAVDGRQLDEHAWHDGNADFITHPVAAKRPDARGVFDMHGNVAEWCTAADGTPVVMGGSFLDPPERLGPAGRELESPAWNESDPQIPKGRWWLADADFIGFRIICVQQ